jgi:hypothetical protein
MSSIAEIHATGPPRQTGTNDHSAFWRLRPLPIKASWFIGRRMHAQHRVSVSCNRIVKDDPASKRIRLSQPELMQEIARLFLKVYGKRHLR